MDIKDKIKKLPDSCGVYLMKSKEGRILYVGKAASLKKRVASYFSPNLSEKNRLLAEKIKKIDFIKCENPQQALILEAALIKEKKPKYNIALKDNKSYPYLEITQEKYPRVFISRPFEKRGSFFFGPYTDVNLLKEALKAIRRIFPFCSCKSKRGLAVGKKVCLYYHLALCSGPCAGKVTVVEYNDGIKAIKKILKGKRPELLSFYRKKMKVLASQKKFEKAAKLRDKIYALENIYRQKPKLHQLIILKESLGLPRLPLLIEAIDTSALGRKDATGSVVVFKDAIPNKDAYRRFLIKGFKLNDDYKRIEEVVSRRYRRLVKEKKQLPDLVLIDGGKGHLSGAKRVLDKLGLNIPLVGLAKKKEEVWLPGKSKPENISEESPALRFLQRIRDEAHRFAHSYHVLRRRKSRSRDTPHLDS